jgi:hypothetical protein
MDKKWSTNTTQKPKDWATRTSLKTLIKFIYSKALIAITVMWYYVSLVIRHGKHPYIRVLDLQSAFYNKP